MHYVDGLVTAVVAAKKDFYVDHAKKVAQILKDNGAISVVECWGDDVPDGKLTSFPLAVQKTADEVVVFSWIAWPSKAVRDEGWKVVMADPRMKFTTDMPFDVKRMIYGGFQQVL
jgi:uncharacterized protein YbaA (DUF1428 family)